MIITHTMKSILFAIMILVATSKVLAQQPFPRTQDVYSVNNQFHVQVTGLYYEGFVGDQRISLMNAKGDTLWKKVVPRRFLILPAVSNKGDVAITQREISIFDKSEKLKGTLPLESGESPYNTGDYEGTVHAFSQNGDRYFIFMSYYGDNDVELLCLTDSARKLWSKSLGYFAPHEMIFYQDKIIVDDCGLAGANYTNYCYVLDSDGNILWQYQTNSRSGSDWRVELNAKNGFLSLTDKSSQFRVKLDSLRAGKQ